LTGVDDKIGQAALYGIYYDDTEYDYMQHLRPVGVYEDGMETILIEAPPIREKKPGVVLDDLPPQVLPSSSEVPRNYESQEAIPSSIAGFKPDMDPHLRQVLEALEDEAFVDDELEDDFFAELVVEGERKESDAIHYEFQENGDSDVGEVNDVDDSWEARYANFKKTQKTEDASATSDVGEHSEGGDTIGHLPPLSVIGGKRRRKGTSDASGYSMTSSSLFRTEALQTLDERFDQVRSLLEGSAPSLTLERSWCARSTTMTPRTQMMNALVIVTTTMKPRSSSLPVLILRP
jgi:protein LTV1